MSYTCGLCQDDLAEGVHCSICKQTFHYQCASLTETGYRRLGNERKQAWKCQKCKQLNITPPSPQPPSNADLLQEIRALASQLAPLVPLAQEVKAIRGEISEVKSQVAEIITSVREFNDRFERIEARLAEVEKGGEKVTSMGIELNKLLQEANDKDQWARMNNAEIKGIPQTQKENLINIVCSIGSKVDYHINKSQLNFVTRIPTKDTTQPKPIIVAFINRYAKEDFIAAFRERIKATKLTAADFGFKGHKSAGGIYVNDHLTPQNKDLLTKTKKLALEKGFAYTWVKHAKIYVRKSDTSPVIQVKSLRDHVKLV